MEKCKYSSYRLEFPRTRFGFSPPSLTLSPRDKICKVQYPVCSLPWRESSRRPPCLSANPGWSPHAGGGNGYAPIPRFDVGDTSMHEPLGEPSLPGYRYRYPGPFHAKGINNFLRSIFQRHRDAAPERSPCCAREPIQPRGAAPERSSCCARE